MFEPHFDANGNFIHPCCICGAHAGLGFGVSLLKGQLGTWFCQTHKPPPSEMMMNGQASILAPMVPRPDEKTLDEISRDVEAEMSTRGITRDNAGQSQDAYHRELTSFVAQATRNRHRGDDHMDDNTFNDHEPAPPIKANVPTETGMVNPYAVFRQRNSSGGLFRGDTIKCDSKRVNGSACTARPRR